MHANIARSAIQRAIARHLDDGPQPGPDVPIDVVVVTDSELRLPKRARDE